MTPRTYPELLRRLTDRFGADPRWGLDRMRRILEAAGRPHLRYPTIQIGGTNGKGSAAAAVAAALTASGRRTGLYTSPHLCSLRERVRVDGEPISEAALLEAARRLWAALEAEAPSFFEATTAIGLAAFADAAVDAAVVEVGLGGRLDATTVIEPVATAITNVGLEHTEVLGDTLDDVAREKAGILRRGVPVVTAEPADQTRDRLHAEARAVGAPFAALDAGEIRELSIGLRGTSYAISSRAWGPLEIRTPLVGAHQAMNTALAVRVLERLPRELRPDGEAVVRGLAAVDWPGRFQVESIGGRYWIFDVAHNLDGMRALVETLGAVAPPRPWIAVAGMLADKPWPEMLARLGTVVDGLILTQPSSAPERRRWSLDAALAAVDPAKSEAQADLRRALLRADEPIPTGPAGTIVVTGSVHTVGDALAAVAGPPWQHRVRSLAPPDPPLQRPPSPA